MYVYVYFSDAPDEDPVCHGHDHAAVGGHEVGDGVLRREVHPLLGEDRSLLQQLLVDELRGAHPCHDVTGCALLVRGQSLV